MFKFLCDKIKSPLGIQSGVEVEYFLHWFMFMCLCGGMQMCRDIHPMVHLNKFKGLIFFFHCVHLFMDWTWIFRSSNYILNPFLDFKENSTLITIVASPVYIQFTCSLKLTMNKGSSVPISSPAFLVLRQPLSFLSFFSFLLYCFFFNFVEQHVNQILTCTRHILC